MYEYSNQIWYNTVLSCIRFHFYILVIFLWEKFRQFLKQDCVNKKKFPEIGCLKIYDTFETESHCTL